MNAKRREAIRLAREADDTADAATDADGYRRAADLADQAGSHGAAAGYRATADAIDAGADAPAPAFDRDAVSKARKRADRTIHREGGR